MKLIRYDIENPGILPEGFAPSYVSGSWAYAKIDERIPAFNNLNYITVDDYEYASEPQRIFHEAVEAGYDTGLGYSLGLSTEDRNAFATFLTQYANKEALGTATASSTVALADTDGHLHYMTLQEARVILDAYGDYYSGLWVAYKSAIS